MGFMSSLKRAFGMSGTRRHRRGRRHRGTRRNRRTMM
jgi:hypothetical protein